MAEHPARLSQSQFQYYGKRRQVWLRCPYEGADHCRHFPLLAFRCSRLGPAGKKKDPSGARSGNMLKRPPFLNTAYGAYHHRDRPPADKELTRVGPGTPCGEYLRRFWQPVILSEELGDLPRRLRILGEDLVAFRDRGGAVGLLELHCPHRGTSLEFGLISERGIRCCYHGWLFGVDGTILETPGEGADSTLKDRLFHGAYLHTLPGSQGFTEDLGALGEWDWMETPAGMVYIDTRRQGDRVWVRVADFIPPNIHQFPPNADPMAKRTTINRPMATTWAVPLDDTHTMQIGYYRAPERQETRRGPGFGQDASRSYEERQRVPGDYDAQTSIHGGVARHGLEHLASTDRGVTMLRNMIRAGFRAVQNGEDLRLDAQCNGGAIVTYAHDRVVSGIPAAPTSEEDSRLLREVARAVVTEMVRNAGENPS